MGRKLTWFVSLCAAIAFSQAVRAFSQAEPATTWYATVGAQSPDKGVQALAFLPNEMWIRAGDSIKWTFSANENHSVTVLKIGQPRPTFAAGCPGGIPPDGHTADPSVFDGSNCVNSGLIATPGTPYTVTFTNIGNYVVVCLLHANQSATIHVLSASEPTLPHDQEFYDRQARVEERDLLYDRDGGLGAKLREDAPPDSDDGNPHAHHGMHIVVMGAGELVATPGGAQSVSKMRFGRESITIHAGQTVEWASSDVSGHSVAWGQEPPGGFTPLDHAAFSDDVVVSNDPDGVLHVTVTSPPNDKTRVYSGRIAPASQERTGLGQSAPGATRFRVTFTTKGTYRYVCAYHDEIGMKGEVIVLP